MDPVEVEEEEVEYKPKAKSKIMEVYLEMEELLSMIMARKTEGVAAAVLGPRRT